MDIEAFLAQYTEPARPAVRLTVARRPERTRDSFHRLLAAAQHYLKLAREDK